MRAPSDVIVPAGFNSMSDSYSAFRDNDNKSKNSLLDIIKGQRISQIFVCGLATDFCVLFTALDARILSDAQVFLVKDACRALSAEGEKDAFMKLAYEGIRVISSTDRVISQIGAALPPPTLCPSEKAPQDSKNEFLIWSARRLDVESVRAALRVGASLVAAPLPLGYNVLHAACAVDVHSLDMGGADVPITQRQAAAITAKGNLSPLQLVTKGADPDVVDARCGDSVNIIQLLLAAKHPPSYLNFPTASDSPVGGGYTPLMLAAERGNVAAVRAMIAAGADLDFQERREGQTALMLACSAKFPEVVRILVAAGAQSFMATAFKRTALMYAMSATETVALRRAAAAAANIELGAPEEEAAGGAGGATGATSVVIGRVGSTNGTAGHAVTVGSSRALLRRPDAATAVDAAGAAAAATGDGGNDALAPQVSLALETTLALLHDTDRSELVSLLKHRDDAGWNALHFAARTGLLAAMPWKRLLGGEPFSGRAVRAKTTVGSHGVLHLAVWNRNARDVWLLTPPQDSLLKSKGRSRGFVPWVDGVNVNERSGGAQHAPVDLAFQLGNHDVARMILRAGGFAATSASANTTQELVRAVLNFDTAAALSLLAYDANSVTHEAHVLGLVQLIKRRGTCTFSFAGYNNPTPQHMDHCNVCGVDVCLMCADVCHAHPEREGAERTAPEPLGYVATPQYCKCPRRSCLCSSEESAFDTSGWTPQSVVSEAQTLVFVGNRLLVTNAAGAASDPSPTEDESIAGDLLEVLMISLAQKESAAEKLLVDGDGGARAAQAAADGGARREKSPTVWESRLSRLVARSLHAVWVMFKLFAGWRHADHVDVAECFHPDLTSFQALSTEARNGYLTDAQWMLKAIVSLGFTVELPEIARSDGSSRVPLAETEDGSSDETAGGARSLASPLSYDHFTLAILLAENKHNEWVKQELERRAQERSAAGISPTAHMRSPPHAVAGIPTPGAAGGGEPRRESQQSASASTDDQSSVDALMVPFEFVPSAERATRVYSFEMAIKVLLSYGVRMRCVQPFIVATFRANIAAKKTAERNRERVQEETLRYVRRHMWGGMLLRAARRGDNDLVFKVMEIRGVSPAPDVNYRNQGGLRQSPLHMAAAHGHVAVVKRLLSYHARPDLVDVQGLTPLAAAAFNGHDAVVRALLKHGASPLSSDAYGLTPMHHISYFAQYNTARLFARHLTKLRNTGELWTAAAKEREKVGTAGTSRRWAKLRNKIRPAAAFLTIGEAKKGATAGGPRARAQTHRQQAIEGVHAALAGLNTDEKAGLIVPDGALIKLTLGVKELLPEPTAFESIMAAFSKVGELSHCCRRRNRDATLPDELKTAEHLNVGGDCRYHPLALAVKARHAKMVGLLLRFEADPTRPDATGLSPYFRALREHAAARYLRKVTDGVIKEIAAAPTAEDEEDDQPPAGSEPQLDSQAPPASLAQKIIAQQKKEAAQAAGSADGMAETKGGPTSSVARGTTSATVLPSASAGSPKAPRSPKVAFSEGKPARELEAGRGRSASPTHRSGAPGPMSRMARRFSNASSVSTVMGTTAKAQTKIVERAKAVARKYGRLERDVDKVLKVFNRAPQVRSLRRLIAVQVVSVRFVMFVSLILALLLMSPFAFDYELEDMNFHTRTLRDNLADNIARHDVTSLPHWWQWLDKAVFGAASAGAAGRGYSGAQVLDTWYNDTILEERDDGTITMLGFTLIGPLMLSVTRLVPQGLHVGNKGVSGTLSCDVSDELIDVLGDCGGAGVAASMTEGVTPGVLEYQEQQTLLTGTLEDMHAGAREVFDVPGDLVVSKLSFSLFHPVTEAFAFGHVALRVSGTGAASGSGTIELDTKPLLLFHDRLPPSVPFELTVVLILALVVAWMCVQLRGAKWSLTAYIAHVENKVDVLLLGMLIGLAATGISLRLEADSAADAIITAASAGQRGSMLNGGVSSAAGDTFIDLESIGDGMQTLADILAVGMLLAGARLIVELTLLPGLGPMLVAVTATLGNLGVQLYLSLLAGMIVLFGLAFNLSVGPDSPTFATMPATVVALFQIALGEISFIEADRAPRPLTTILFVLFILIVGVVTLNLFVGVLLDVYPEAKRRSEADWEELITNMMESRFDIREQLAGRTRRLRLRLIGQREEPARPGRSQGGAAAATAGEDMWDGPSSSEGEYDDSDSDSEADSDAGDGSGEDAVGLPEDVSAPGKAEARKLAAMEAKIDALSTAILELATSKADAKEEA